ncbi:DUF2829 domain-containing protein [Pluralibacter gergoviae]|uniref:DUF2829 domain-containing protein n=1 Tax=Pluralibacter gergoviae TaxID=61647 RepID=A0AAW8HMK9_PLUGE|nr:DUF2829 domain-containing protein [Pluralibacter gergoviae]MDQ2309743.1 DUF2829 domain-containing protein [Pluralibacter gergoviae]
MADLTAVEGSFEWAMLELKNGKRVSREAWKDRSMYLVLNPGEPGQTVKDGDWRALAGVPVDTKFDYLPNIEICNAEGNFVPYQPSQVDMEMKNWGELASEPGNTNYMLVVDITNGQSLGEYISCWGYSITTTGSKCTIIENTTPAQYLRAFQFWTGNTGPNALVIDFPSDENTMNYYSKILSKPVTIMVDGVFYTLPVGSGPTTNKSYSVNFYPIDGCPELHKKFLTKDEIHRFYCKWAD